MDRSICKQFTYQGSTPRSFPLLGRGKRRTGAVPNRSEPIRTGAVINDSPVRLIGSRTGSLTHCSEPYFLTKRKPISMVWVTLDANRPGGEGCTR